MQRFQKMVTIPEDEYTLLRSMQQVGDPLQKHFQTLSGEYSKQESLKDPHDRVLRQGETLNEMIKTKDMLRRRLHESTPKPYQHRASSLFDHMKEKMPISEKGEIYSKDGDVIEGSNIADLVQHAVRDRRRKYTPMGWNMFLTHLKDSNAPKMVMNYDTLEELKPSAAAAMTTPSPASSIVATSPKRRSRSITPRVTVNSRQEVKVKREPKLTALDSYMAMPSMSHLRKQQQRGRRPPAVLKDYIRY